MSKQKRTIILSLIAIVISMSLLVLHTYSLFTEELNIVNRVEAGVLDVDFYRTKLSKEVLNGQGGFDVLTDDVVYDLKNSDIDIFDIENAVPMNQYQAKFLVNNNSEIAVSFSLSVLFSSTHSEENNELAKQIQIVITCDDETVMYEGTLYSFIVNVETLNLGVLMADSDALEFDVKLTFLSDQDNNTVQGKHIELDFKLYAVQYIEE